MGTNPYAATGQDRVAAESARLVAGPMERLNFGCGTFPLEGWTNIDGGDGEWYGAPEDERVIALDVFEAIAALPTAVASRVVSEHFFEHFTLEQGHRILRGWFRVLKPGGVTRIVCPDLTAEAKLFLKQIEPAPASVIDRHRLRWLADRYRFRDGEKLTRAMVLNYGMWLDGHKFVYDEETLRQSMELAGFVNVTRRAFGESGCDDLRGIDHHDGGETGRGWVESLALVMEGTKPAGASVGVVEDRGVAVGSVDARGGARKDGGVSAYKLRLAQVTAELCAARGYKRVALFGAGRHTAGILGDFWREAGVRVVAVLDDSPKVIELGGVPVVQPDRAGLIDAVVVSSDAYEEEIYQRARALFESRGVPVVRIYGEGFTGPR